MKNAAALLEEYSMKRIISFFLCVLMTATLLAGCGDRKHRNTWIIAVDGDFSPFVCADANVHDNRIGAVQYDNIRI